MGFPGCNSGQHRSMPVEQAVQPERNKHNESHVRKLQAVDEI